MKNFQFSNPTKILFGKDQVDNLPKEIPANSKVMIMYGGGSIKKLGLLDKVKDVLKGYELGEFGGIEPNPAYETLLKAVEIVRRDKYNFLLAIGGGSVIDGTKFVAAAAPYTESDPWYLLAQGKPVKTALPVGTILTLPATGSEMNANAVITRKSESVKMNLYSKRIFPVFSVLDPVYTYSLPRKQVSNGIVDTFMHVIEQYLTFPADAKIQDRFSEGILLTVLEEGPKALSEPENYDVRANLMWASTMALNGLISTGVPQDWATHNIGHELTTLFGLDHAQTLAVILPALLQVQKEQKRAKLLQYAERVLNIKDLPDDEKIDAAINKTRDFFESVGVPTRLSHYGITKADIAKVTEALKTHGMVKLGEKRNVTPEVATEILTLAL